MINAISPIDLNSLIQWGREQRHLEYKQTLNWAKAEAKATITKSVLAMANLRDGGYIIIGVERQADDNYRAVGMADSDFESFIHDHVSDHLAEYADPYIEVQLIKHAIEDRRFLVLQVNEFSELPVVCKKDGLKGLRRGATYVRSQRKPETVEVPSQVEMRELLDLALEKRSKSFAGQAERMEYARLPQVDAYLEQRKALPETPTLQQIWSKPRWRIHIRPTEFHKARFQSVGSCRDFVQLKAVNDAGWQFPITSQDIHQGGDWISDEAEIPPHVDHWTLFQSAQFIHAAVLKEEFIGTDAWPTHPQFFVPGRDRRYLSIDLTLRITSWVFEFAARMAHAGLLSPSAIITIELHGLAGRELSFMSPRQRLDQNYWCKDDSVKAEQQYDAENLRNKPRDLALNAAIEIFSHFGWINPPRVLLKENQPLVTND